MELIDFNTKRSLIFDNNKDNDYDVNRIEKDMTEWEADDWSYFFNEFCVKTAQMIDTCPWQIFSEVMQAVFRESLMNERKD